MASLLLVRGGLASAGIGAGSFTTASRASESRSRPFPGSISGRGLRWLREGDGALSHLPRGGLVRAAEGQPSSQEKSTPRKDLEKEATRPDFPDQELHEEFSESMTLDPSIVAAEKQQSRPARGPDGVTLVPPTGGALAEPGRLQSFMSDEVSDIVDEESGTSSEGALAESDVAPTASGAVDEVANRLLGADGWTKGGESSSGSASAASDATGSNTGASFQSSSKSTNSSTEAQGKVSSEGSLAESDIAPTPTAGLENRGKSSSSVSSEGALAESDIAPTPTASIESRGATASSVSSEGALAESDIAPTPTVGIETRGKTPDSVSSEGALAQSDIAPTPAAGIEARGGASKDSTEQERAEAILDRVLDEEKPLARNDVAPLALGAEPKASDSGFSSEGSLAESDIAPASHAVEGKAAKKTTGTGDQSFRTGHSSEGLLAESDVAPAANSAIESFIGRSQAAIGGEHSSEGLLAESDIAPASQAIEGAADAKLKRGKEQGDQTFRRGHSSEGLLAESDIAPPASPAIANAIAGRPQTGASKRGDENFRTGHTSEGLLAESDVAPAVGPGVESLAEERAGSGKQSKPERKSSGGEQGWLAEAEVAPAKSPAIDQEVDKRTRSSAVAAPQQKDDSALPTVPNPALSISDFEEAADNQAKELLHRVDSPVANLLQAASIAKDIVDEKAGNATSELESSRSEAESDVKYATSRSESRVKSTASEGKGDVKSSAKHAEDKAGGILDSVANFANSLFGGSQEKVAKADRELRSRSDADDRATQRIEGVIDKGQELAEEFKAEVIRPVARKAEQAKDTVEDKLHDSKEWAKDKYDDVKEGTEEAADVAVRKGEQVKDKFEESVVKPAARKGEELKGDVREVRTTAGEANHRPGGRLDTALDEAGAIMDEVEAKRAELRRKADQIEQEARDVANNIRRFGGQCVEGDPKDEVEAEARDVERNVASEMDDGEPRELKQGAEEAVKEFKTQGKVVASQDWDAARDDVPKELKEGAEEARKEFENQGAVVANQDMLKDMLKAAGEPEQAATGAVDEAVWNSFKDDGESPNYQATVEGDALWNEFKQGDEEEGDVVQKVQEAEGKKKDAISQGRQSAGDFEEAAKDRAQRTHGKSFK